MKKVEQYLLHNIVSYILKTASLSQDINTYAYTYDSYV